MEFYNDEGKSLRKKDLVPWYYDSKKKFVQVPAMTDEREKVYSFLKFCVSVSHPDVTQAQIDQVWVEAEDRQPGLLEALDQLKAEHEGNNDLWKAKSYAKAIKTLKTLKVPVLSGAQAQKLPGIGKGIAGVIDEVLRHGRLKTQEERMEGAIERQNVTERFMESIWDVTAKVANEWYSIGNRSIEDLVEKAKEGALPKLTERQKLGLKYHEDLEKEIPKGEVEDIVDVVGMAFEGVNGVEDTEIVGKYRRGLETKEVEMAVKIDRKPTKGFVKGVAKNLPPKFVVDTPIIDASKFSAIVRVKSSGVHRKLILHFVPKDEWGVALILLTGPDNFIKILKEQAAVMGYGFGGKRSGFVKLSMKDDNDTPVDAPDEKAVFDELGMKTIEPRDRV